MNPQQLKAKIKKLTENMNPSDRTRKSQVLMRNYFMECFLERLSVSKYKDNFIIKGGTLVSSYVGLDERATKDIDTSVNALTLDYENINKILEEIFSIQLNDGVSFNVYDYDVIMDDFDYQGIRFMINSSLDTIKYQFQIDMATNDTITPAAIEYDYKLMTEDRSIKLKAYNLETLLAEKIETIISRGYENTRVKDFYDIYKIVTIKEKEINYSVLSKAFKATSVKRGTFDMAKDIFNILDNLVSNEKFELLWEQYKKKSYFIGDVKWNETIDAVKHLVEDPKMKKCILDKEQFGYDT